MFLAMFKFANCWFTRGNYHPFLGPVNDPALNPSAKHINEDGNIAYPPVSSNMAYWK